MSNPSQELAVHAIRWPERSHNLRGTFLLIKIFVPSGIPAKRICLKVIAETCDLIRVMCYDLYWAPGKGDLSLIERPDTQGMGPASNYPWAREAMKFWRSQTPREKLIMGLPAYSNDEESLCFSVPPPSRVMTGFGAPSIDFG
jgi:hypothetical protein